MKAPGSTERTDISARQMPSPISTTLQSALALVRANREAGRWIGAELDEVIRLLAELPAGAVVPAAKAIAGGAGLFHRLHLEPFVQPPQHVPTDKEQLLKRPELAGLFLFHCDGRLRELALKHFAGGLSSPFLFAAVACRLNDWAEPVREAAVACATRCFPQTDADIVARSAEALLVRSDSWSRWDGERELLDQAFSRADVAEALAELLIAQTNGSGARTLRFALRSSALDPHLMRVAFEAVQPSLRATAFAFLIDGKASWPSGYGWRWVDKSMGERKREIVYAERALTVAHDRAGLIARAVGDRSAVVRRIGLDGVIRHFKGLPEVADWASTLLTDRSSAVRERADFIMKRASA